MSYTRLPVLEHGVEVSAESALQDKIRLSYEGWIAADHSDLAAYNVAQRIAEEEHPIPRDDANRTRQIFNSAKRHRLPSTSIQFTKRAINDAERNEPVYGFPLANGEIDFRNIYEPIVSVAGSLPNDENPDNFRVLPFRVTASLTLNPTRMLNHQRVKEIVFHRDDPEFELPSLSLLTYRRGIAQGDEFTLGEADNILIGARQHLVAFSPLYRRMRWQYITAWDEFIDQRLHEHFGDQVQRNEPRFSLSHIENYFEFRSENPLLQIEQLRPHIRSLGGQMRTMGQRIRTHEEYINGNEIGYVVHMATGIEVAIYAKTNKRIRIEARTELAERERVRSFGQTNHTRDNLSDIVALIEHTASDAASIINDVLRALDIGLPNSSDPILQKAPYELLQEIMRVVFMEYRHLTDNALNRRKMAVDQDALISIIIHRNGIALPFNQKLAKAVARLQRRGVLQPPVRRFRRLSANYQEARSILYSSQSGYSQSHPDS